MSSSSSPASQASTMNSEQSSQRLTLKTKKESLEDALSDPFTPFDVESMASAYDEESAKMVQFETDLNEMFLSVMLDVRAWALARPLIEQDNARVELSDKLREIERIEEDQGRSSFFEQTRLKLFNFIQSIKSALAALTSAAAIL